jgi:hypothetical protein
LTKCSRHLTIHPDFGVIIDRRFKNSRRSCEVEIVRARRDGDVDPVPIEAKPAGGTPRIERCWIDLLPFRVIEIRAASVRREIVRFNRLAGWLFIWTCCFEIDLNDFRVAVTPLTFNKIDTFFRREIDYCVRFPIWRVGVVSASARPAKKISTPKTIITVKRNRHIDALMGASRCARLNSIAHARTSEVSMESVFIATNA